MKPLKDKWLQIIGTPVAALVAAGGSWLWEPATRNTSFLLHYSIMFLLVVVCWYFCRIFLIRTRQKYPGFKESFKRVPISLAIYSIIIFVVLGIHLLIVNTLNVYKVILGFEYWMKLYLFALFNCYMVAGIYETLYFFEQWVDSQKVTERLKLEAMHSQLESLKNQVKPHFLFNSLNSLMALIDEDQTKAKKFLQELSSVYRYLLQSNEKTLVTLSEELEFAEAYCYLLKTRFEDGLTIKVSVRQQDRKRMLPPLTLQMLIENAVKHNKVDSNKPLTVSISIDDKQNLVVVNNLQKKNSMASSNRVGLANISAKYKLLNQPEMKVNETTEEFKVVLPLVTP
jgi:LytS/YehU family sensor histidine kinase